MQAWYPPYTLENHMSLKEKSFLVTGGTGALGAAVVQRLLDAGASVHLTCIHEDERKASHVPSDAQIHVVDLACEDQVEELYSQIGGLYGSIHVAGGFSMGPIERISAEDFQVMMAMNALSCFLCCREAVKAMRTSGSEGRIVNVAARPALEPAGGMLAYTTSKAAVASMTECLAKEVIGEGILVNAVVPSIMDTPANRAGMPDADFSAWPSVDSVAHTIVGLASPCNQLTSGALVPVYGNV